MPLMACNLRLTQWDTPQLTQLEACKQAATQTSSEFPLASGLLRYGITAFPLKLPIVIHHPSWVSMYTALRQLSTIGHRAIIFTWCVFIFHQLTSTSFWQLSSQPSIAPVWSQSWPQPPPSDLHFLSRE